jgi:hypothetical protein
MRRLLMFLVEKLSKDITSTSGLEQDDSLKKSKNLNELISQKVKESLDNKQFWLPTYCKFNSLRIQEDESFIKEVNKYKKKIN